MNNMRGRIYKITNPNGRIYIGKTTDFKQRVRQYKGLHCKTQPALYNSIAKWGFDSHKIEIIDECSCDDLSSKEIYYIEHYNSFKDGLNCTLGGDGSFMPGDLNISKRSDVRKKMSDSKIEFYKNNKHPSKGVKRSLETINRIKTARAKQMKIIRCYVLDLETGIYYEGIKDVANMVGVNYKCFFNRVKNTQFYKNKYKVC